MTRRRIYPRLIKSIALVGILFSSFAFMTNEARIFAFLPDNPLLVEWAGPYGGIPPFDKVKVTDFKPALEVGMAENLSEVEKIANDPASPTFENTIAALERTGKTLSRVSTIYGIWGGNMATPEYQ